MGGCGGWEGEGEERTICRGGCRGASARRERAVRGPFVEGEGFAAGEWCCGRVFGGGAVGRWLWAFGAWIEGALVAGGARRRRRRGWARLGLWRTCCDACYGCGGWEFEVLCMYYGKGLDYVGASSFHPIRSPKDQSMATNDVHSQIQHPSFDQQPCRVFSVFFFLAVRD